MYSAVEPIVEPVLSNAEYDFSIGGKKYSVWYCYKKGKLKVGASDYEGNVLKWDSCEKIGTPEDAKAILMSAIKNYKYDA